MATYKTPGVYVQEKTVFPSSVSSVETAVPVFIGFTETAWQENRDCTGIPVRIDSMLAYENAFGRAFQERQVVVTAEESGPGVVYKAAFDTAAGGGPSPYHMYYALHGFFQNGGRQCYIVSLGKYSFPFNLAVAASQVAAVLSFIRLQRDITLVVVPDCQQVREEAYNELISALLVHCEENKNRFAIIDLPHSGAGLSGDAEIMAVAEDFRSRVSGPAATLSYGAAYFPNITLVIAYQIDEAHLQVVKAGVKQSFLRCAQMEQEVIRQALQRLYVSVPPSGVIAGVYAATDANSGVWKAPANVVLNGVKGLACSIRNAAQEKLNISPFTGKSINAIRFFTGKGILVWGARTLDGNSNDWRYIPVRRFAILLEESVNIALKSFVFEPNNNNTWMRVKAMVENYGMVLWREGALLGTKAEDAFFVQVGLGQTMTAQDVAEGRLLLTMGVAVVRPAEFHVFTFQLQLSSP